MPMGGAMRWVPFDADWWPVAVASLPKPWPIELVYFDLRWWANQAQYGAVRPSRPALMRRWGLSDWSTRAAIRAEGAWETPLKNQNQPDGWPDE